MKIKSPELQKAVTCMNTETQDLIKEFQKNLDALHLKHEEDTHVTLINGDKRRVKVNTAVAEIYDDVKQIRTSTAWITKPKVIIAIVVFIVAQVFAFGVWKGSTDTKIDHIKTTLDENHQDIKEILKNTE